MIKKIFTLFIFFFLTFEAFAAGTSSSDKKPSYKNAVKTVSYTHLTLPTIYSV